MNDVVREMLDLLRSQAAQCSVSLRADLTAKPAFVTADLVQLRQVLMNLILNGIEAMQESGGELTVTSRVAPDGELTISVSDTGSGCPPNIQIRFSRRFSAPNPRAAAWACRSAARSSSRTAAVCGQPPTQAEARRFTSRCPAPRTHRGLRYRARADHSAVSSFDAESTCVVTRAQMSHRIPIVPRRQDPLSRRT